MRASQSLPPQALGVCVFVLLPSVRGAAQSAPRITQPVNAETIVDLPGHTHPLARPEYDRGAAPDGLPMKRMLLVLQRAPEQETALRELLGDQQIKSSPNYHKWLTPDQFGQQFGPADADIQAMTDWLASQGFQVERVAAGRTVIEFSGTAALVRQALHTEIHKFRVNGEEHWANVSDPQIPVTLAPAVAGIVSLHNFPREHYYRRVGTFSRSKTTGELRPLFTFTPRGQPTFHALGPTDFATIYSVPSNLDGTGQTIAIVAQSKFNASDVTDFRQIFGLPPNNPNIILNGPDPGVVTTDESEAVLDAEWSGAVAKNATINLVVSQSTESSAGVDLSALYIVDSNIAPILSDSYGTCESSLGAGGSAFYSSLWQQAAAQGITALVAAGDNGSAGCDDAPGETAAMEGLAVSGIASTPFNVAVGGTDFNGTSNPSAYWGATNSPTTQVSAKSYIPETAWNDSCAAGGGTTGCTLPLASDGSDLTAGGGGPSTCATFTAGGTCKAGYAKPDWQTGTGVPNDGARDVPDVSLFASNGNNGSAYVVCQADANTGSNNSSCDLNAPYQDFQLVGGTSVAAQAFAGIIALIDQKTGERQGNANYVLYRSESCLSNAPSPSCLLYDVVNGNNSVACTGGSHNCTNTRTSADQFGILVDPQNSSSPAWTTTTGYDLATGLGSVNATNLVNSWTSATFAPTTTMLTNLSPTTITHGQPINVSITVTSKSGTPSGAVALTGGPSSALGIVTFSLASGNASGTTNLLPGGTYGVTAHYGGDGAFGSSHSTPPVQVTVNKENSQTRIALVTFDLNGNVTSSNAASAPYGSPYVLRIDVTNSSAQACYSGSGLIVSECPTGSLTVTDNGGPPPDQMPPASATAGTYKLNSLGYAEEQFVQFPAGPHNVVASYGGDNSFNASTSPTDSLMVTHAATAASVNTSASSVEAGTSLTLTGTVSTQSSGAAPSGTVQFMDGSTPISGTVTYAGSAGSASTGAFASLQGTLATSFSATATITVKYSGGANYEASASTPLVVTVIPGFTLSVNPASVNISAPGQSGTSSITVSPTGGFTGTIAFSCTVPPTMREATCSVSPPSITGSGSTEVTVTTVGPHTVAALGSGPDLPMAGGTALLAGLLLMTIPAKKRRLKTVRTLVCVALVAAVGAGCGGGGSGGGGSTTDPGTPTGTYSVSVTAAGGSVSHAVNVSVTLQ